MLVPVSAFEALLGLQLPQGADDGQSRRMLWIDAICIDQNNGTEKEQQILAMNQIYQRARHVFVWLSPGKEEHVDPLRAIRLLEFIYASTVEREKKNVNKYWSVGPTTYPLDDLEPFNHLLGHA